MGNISVCFFGTSRESMTYLLDSFACSVSPKMESDGCPMPRELSFRQHARVQMSDVIDDLPPRWDDEEISNSRLYPNRVSLIYSRPMYLDMLPLADTSDIRAESLFGFAFSSVAHFP